MKRCSLLLVFDMLCFMSPNAYAQETSYDLNLYGFIQLDTSYDTKRVAPESNDSLRPSKVAVTKGQYGSNGETIFSIRPSTLGIKGAINHGQADIKTWLEFDLLDSDSSP